MQLRKDCHYLKFHFLWLLLPPLGHCSNGLLVISRIASIAALYSLALRLLPQVFPANPEGRVDGLHQSRSARPVSCRNTSSRLGSTTSMLAAASPPSSNRLSSAGSRSGPASAKTWTRPSAASVRPTPSTERASTAARSRSGSPSSPTSMRTSRTSFWKPSKNNWIYFFQFRKSFRTHPHF